MEAPSGPLRSPDGLWWWDGRAWQPIATLDVTPPPGDVWQPPPGAASPEPAGQAVPDTGAWQPPAGTEALPSDGWQPPSDQSEHTAAGSVEPPPAVSEPTREVTSAGAWQPPGSTPAPGSELDPLPAQAAASEPAPDDLWGPPAPAPAVHEAVKPSPVPPVAPPEADWGPPSAADSAAPSTPLAAPAPPPSPPPPPAEPAEPQAAIRPATVPPPPPAAPMPPVPEVPWPNWLPRNERSEAVVEDVPVRPEPGAAKPPPAAQSQRTVPLAISGEARSSSWVSQLYPAAAAISANRKLVTYAGLAVLGLIALYVLFQVLSAAGLFTLRGGSAGTPPDTGPSGTQFQQADGFLTGSLNPTLTSLATPMNRIPLDCGGTHSVTCRNTLEDADAATTKAIGVIDKGQFPGCIAITTVQARRDLVNLDQALHAALIGFRTNSDGVVTKGLADFATLAPTIKADGEALKAAAAAGCPKTP
jgi:hypothetical protein